MKRPIDQVVPVGYRVPVSVLEWLRLKAEKEERSQNWIVNKVLRQAMEAEAQEKAA